MFKQAKSCWDVDDDEFWPGVYKASSAPASPTKLSSVLSAPATPKVTPSDSNTVGSVANDFLDLNVLGTDDKNVAKTEEELKPGVETPRDIIKELEDPAKTNPFAVDKHDELMQMFFRDDHHALPADYPARRMHLLDSEAYINSIDPVIEYVHPRLCDAVATILFETAPKCLDDFMNPAVKTFEWRHSYHISLRFPKHLSVVIRREGNKVLTGTYRNHGFKYFWKSFIRSYIHVNGEWTEMFADGAGETDVTDAGPQYNTYLPKKDGKDQDRMDPQLATYAGRKLGVSLLEQKVWEYYYEPQEMVEWEADGQVTQTEVTKPSRKFAVMEEKERAGPVMLFV